MSRSPSRSSGVGLTRQAANGTFAPLISPALTGTPTVNAKPIADVPTATGKALVMALILGS